MTSNLDRFKKDLNALIAKGTELFNAIQYDCYPDQFRDLCKKELKEKTNDFIKGLPDFKSSYQQRYSEALSMLRQVQCAFIAVPEMNDE